MVSITRIYNKNGAYLEDIDFFDFGKMSSSSSRDPQIISLHVDSVTSISNIQLNLSVPQNVDIDEGFVEYYSSKDIITDFTNIQKKTFKLNELISIDNFGSTDSEYVYLWFNPQKITFRGQFILRFKWTFNYVESSSSSSSSSCQYGEYITIYPFEEKNIHAIDCETVLLKLDLGYSDYCTVIIDSDVFVIENNDGVIIVNDYIFADSDICEEIILSGGTYSVCSMDLPNLIMKIYRTGDCTNDPHLILTNENDFLLIDGSEILLLDGTDLPKDKLLLTDSDYFLFVGNQLFSLLENSSSSSSSSSSP